MVYTISLTNQDVIKKEPMTLFSPKNPTPAETIFLSNIDQAVTFPVEVVFFFEVPPNRSSSSAELVKKSMAEVLLVPYYFMAGRLSFNRETKRLELLCNNAGVLFVSAEAPGLALKDLGNLSAPNLTFHHLIHRPGIYESLAETPLCTVQCFSYYLSVTRFKCGGFSLGFLTNHAIIDGKSASEMFRNLASICRGEGLKFKGINNDRTCLKSRTPPQIKYPHKEYIHQENIFSLPTCFTTQNRTSPSPLIFSPNYIHKMFPFTYEMIHALKEKAMTKCSTFEAIVAHIWRARTKAVFCDKNEFSSVLFAVDIRSKISPPLAEGFVGNAVITAFATAKVGDLVENPLSFSVEKVKEGRERVNDNYIRSVIDWLELYNGIPATCNGNFYVSAWWKLTFEELDFWFGKAVHGGPVVSGNDEFVLLLSDGSGVGVNVWMGLENEKMKKFITHVFEI